MTPSEVRPVILEVLRQVQSMSGREWTDLTADAKPIGVLDGFDSLSAVEVTVIIEEKLGCELDVNSIFVSDDGKRALTVDEIAERVCKLVVAKGKTK